MSRKALGTPFRVCCFRDSLAVGTSRVSRSVSLLDSSEIDGTVCLRISFKDSYEIELEEEETAYYRASQRPLPDPTMTIDEVYWIDSATFVLRRIDDMKDGQVQSRTDYYPSLNQPIPESALVFDPDLE